MNLSPKIKDQWTLTNILISINENPQMGSAFEEQLLPSLQWLRERVKNETPVGEGYYEIGQWRKIYRDLLTEILARRYHQTGEYFKEALCVGAADIIESENTGNGDSRGVDFMRNKLASEDVEKLYALLTAKQRTKLEDFLINHNSISLSAVTDFAGTSYLRDYDYANAIKWFKKSPDIKSPIITKNPFADLLYDQEEQLATESKFSTSKLIFAETMLLLQQQIQKDTANAARYYYKIANGLYNITYYGHTWELVQYYRSGSDGYSMPKDANTFQKEYYGCFAAQDYFKKAMIASADKNFRAGCLFMMAKCSQKQVPKPAYNDFNYSWDKMDAAQKAYVKKFKKNAYFTKFIKEYSSTPFYKEVYSSCSYLRDFVKKKQ